MAKPNNIIVDDRIHGSAGPFGPDADGDFAVENRKLAWREQTVNYKTLKLTEVKVGDDLSGATINFNPNNLPMFLNPNAGLSNFQWVVWSGTSGSGLNIHVAWNANSIQDGNMNYIYNVPSGDLTIPSWLEDTYTFPENSIVTDMYDLGGNRQNWDDVIAGCDPSGWNPSMAEVRIRIAPINTMDSVPKENSKNLITSGGVYNFATATAPAAAETGNLSDIVVGQNLDGAILALPYTMAIPRLQDTDVDKHFIDFSDGSWIGWDSAIFGWGQFDTNGDPIDGLGEFTDGAAGMTPNEWIVDTVDWWRKTHTIPIDTGNITYVAPDIKTATILFENTQYTTVTQGKRITVQDIYNSLHGIVTESDLTTILDHVSALLKEQSISQTDIDNLLAAIEAYIGGIENPTMADIMYAINMTLSTSSLGLTADQVRAIVNDAVKGYFVIELTPTKDSPNLVTSGGVFSMVGNKADKIIINPLTGPEITAGADLSNSELKFGLADNISWKPNDFAWITFTDGSTISWSQGSYAWSYYDSTGENSTMIVEGGNYWTADGAIFGPNKVVSAVNNPGDSVFINDSKIVGDAVYINLIDVYDILNDHIQSDEGRWQSTLDYQVALEARLKKYVEDRIAGVTFPVDYGNPTLVMGNGGLVNLLDGQEWTAPTNGAIVCASGGLLSVAYSVLVDGVSEWDSPLYALGIKIGGGESPSPEIPITAGQVVTASGLLSLGSPINVTFYRNKA